MEQGFVGQSVLVLEGFAWLNQVYRFEVGAIEFEALNPSRREFTLEDEDDDEGRGRFNSEASSLDKSAGIGLYCRIAD
jgi:hypothetical protein